ncbi:hypothetical protein [Actinoplanes sp. NPDC051859]|uniref:hypothetical protein n=1 Tax=Actinoplanes sp. NPDC051859 TaxID=3363909 RepID=UPI0037951A72
MTPTDTAPGLFDGLFDDAAVFPPGDAPMADAVRLHRERWATPQAPLLGPFICSFPRWAELTGELTGGAPLAVSLTLPSGADQVDAAIAEVGAEPRVRLVALEVPASAATLSTLIAALDRYAPPGVPTYVELPLGDVTPAQVAALVGAGLRLKVRTGGVVASAFPSEPALAAAVQAAVRGDAAFKLTAGLHDPIRHRDPATGFEHHGFLNVLVATSRAIDGADTEAVAAALADQDGARIAAAIAGMDAVTAARVRRHFVSFGTCSVVEPIDGLRHHGLLREEQR